MSPSKLTLLLASGALLAVFAGSTPAHAADAGVGATFTTDFGANS